MKTTEHLGLFVPEGDDFFFGEDGPEQKNPDIIDAAYQDHEARVATLEGKTDYFYADIEAYYGNTKLIDDFQDVSGYVAGGSVQSADSTNVKVGKQSLRLTENDNVPAFLYTTKSFALDASKLNNGEEFSDEDYIVGVVYISDIAKFEDYVTFNLCSQEPYSSSNFAEVRESVSNLNTGWNYIKKKKSEVNVYGTGFDWSDIKTIRVTARSVTNAQGAYVSFQLLQFVKKDPLEDYPNPFQRNGIREFAINNGEWFVGKELEKVVWKELSASDNIVTSLVGNKLFNNFIAFSRIRNQDSPEVNRYFSVQKDSNNYIEVCIRGIDTLIITIKVNGVSIIFDQIPYPIDVGDVLSYGIQKDGTNIEILTYKNNDLNTLIKRKYTADISDLKLVFGHNVSGKQEILSASITEITHAHHANIAEVAKSLMEQPFAVFYLSANQSVPNNDETIKVLFDAVYEGNDMLTLNDDGTITINETGKYIVIVNSRWAIQSAGIRGANINNLSKYVMARTRLPAVSTDETEFNTVASGIMKKNDKIAVIVYQNSGAPLSLLGQYRDFTNMTVIKVG